MATQQWEFGTDKALLRQEGDELVAEQVRIDPFLNACNHRIVLDDLPNASGRKRLQAIRLEELSQQLHGRHWRMAFQTLSAIERLLNSRDRAYVSAGIHYALQILQGFDPTHQRPQRRMTVDQARQSTHELMESLRNHGHEDRALKRTGREARSVSNFSQRRVRQCQVRSTIQVSSSGSETNSFCIVS